MLSREGAKRVSFLPVLIDRQLRPEVLRRGDARFDDAVRFMEWVSEDHPHRFTVDGDEVVVIASDWRNVPWIRRCSTALSRHE